MKLENAIGKPCPIANWFDGAEGEITPFKGPTKFEYIQGLDDPKKQTEAMLRMINDAIDLSWDSLFPGVEKTQEIKDSLSLGFCVKMLAPIAEANGLGDMIDVKKAQEALKGGDKGQSSEESPTSKEKTQPKT